jgi:two-component system response regulator AtoC
MKRVLVIDDETAILESLEMYLRVKGLDVYAACAGVPGLRAFAARRPHLVILDIRLPDVSGLEILRDILKLDQDAKVIMITAFHDMETTIEAMRLGAYDYIHKPIDIRELDAAVDKGLRVADTEHIDQLAVIPEQDTGRRRIVGGSPGMRAVFKTIGLLAANRATALIQGETGSGKELIARVIHDSSVFSDQPFVTVDCTTLVDSLFESELFGYERGAFTGAGERKKGRLEPAGEGAIFFDEIGDLPLALQAKLLRFLEYREYTRVGGTETLLSKARVIAATNHNLVQAADAGRFRHDLLFRLNVVTISVPPLRDRLEDIPELVRYFLGKINEELGARVTRIEESAMRALMDYSWPGNVRELKNALTKAAMESRGAVLLADSLLLQSRPSGISAPSEMQSLDDMAKRNILRVMTRTNGNITAAAKLLGLSRPTLRKRLKQYGLHPYPTDPSR